MSLNWDDLKVLLAVARAGSLSRAGVMLGIDQSTIGRRLSAVEAAFGTGLFLRDKTGVTPTEVGQRLVDHALEIERRIDRMAEAGVPDTEPSGVLRLVGNAWVLERLAERVLSPFLTSHPKMELRLISRLPQVPSRSHPTMSLWFDKAPQPGDFAVRLGQVPYGIYVAEGVDTPDWVTILDEDFPGQAIVRVMEQQRRKTKGVVRLTASDSRILAAAIAGGLGRGLLPVCQGDEMPGLVRLDSGPPPLLRSLHLQTHPDTVQSARVQTAIRWLRGCFAEVFGEPKDGPI